MALSGKYTVMIYKICNEILRIFLVSRCNIFCVVYNEYIRQTYGYAINSRCKHKSASTGTG